MPKVIRAGLMAAALLSLDVWVYVQAQRSNHDLYLAQHHTMRCDGVWTVLVTDKTNAHQWASEHCRAYDFPANQDFDPLA